MSHRTAAATEARRLLALPNAVILDSETTDLNGYFVQLSILSLDGTPLLDTLVNPLVPVSDGARRVHGISDDQLIGAPTFVQIEPGLRALLHGRDVIVYNVRFDRNILEGEIARIERARGACGGVGGSSWSRAVEWANACRWHCVMELYAEYVGQWRRGSYRWQPLPGGDHTAIGDCRAALAVLRRMAESEGLNAREL